MSYGARSAAELAAARPHNHPTARAAPGSRSTALLLSWHPFSQIPDPLHAHLNKALIQPTLHVGTQTVLVAKVEAELGTGTDLPVGQRCGEEQVPCHGVLNGLNKSGAISPYICCAQCQPSLIPGCSQGWSFAYSVIRGEHLKQKPEIE